MTVFHFPQGDLIMVIHTIRYVPDHIPPGAYSKAFTSLKKMFTTLVVNLINNSYTFINLSLWC